jgi:hypothetical protein
MTLRKVMNAEECYPGTQCRRWNMVLECGHTITWVYVNVKRRMPQKKRCHRCETIAAFAVTHPSSYSEMAKWLRKVAADDRPHAMYGWVTHCLRAHEFCRRIPGLEPHIAWQFADTGGLYPLPTDDDEGDEFHWQPSP